MSVQIAVAALMGVTRESVARGLKELGDAGIIELKGREINIIELERLESLSKRG